MESSPFQIIEESKSDDELPRLSISHLLMFMTGMSIALAIAFSNRNAVSGIEAQVILAVIGLWASIVLGVGGTFLVWVGVRWLRGKKLPLVDPGAKFAFILSAAILLKWILSLMVMTLLWLPTNSPVLLYFLLPTLIGLFIWGFWWIKETPWRVIIAAQALTTVICLVPLSTTVGAGALIYASIQDRRNKHSRHWTHYLGILLWFFGQIPVI